MVSTLPMHSNAVIGAAAGEVDQVGHQVAFEFLGIDEVGHAELLARAFSVGLRSTPTILSAPTRRAPWITLRPMPPRPNTTTLEPGLDLGRVDDRADPGGHTAADVADLVEGRVFTNLGQRDFRRHGKIREGRAAHIVQHRLAAEGKAAAAVGHQALALGHPDRLAEIGLGIETVLARPAFRRVERDHMIALFETGDTGPGIDHHAGTLVTENGWKQAFRVVAGQGERIRVADSRRLDLDQNLALPGAFELDRLDRQRLSSFKGNGGAYVHDFPSQDVSSALRPRPISSQAEGMQGQIRRGIKTALEIMRRSA